VLFFDFHLFLRGCFGLLGFKHAANCLIPSYIRRGTGGHRDSRRWEIRELIYTYVTLSPPECLCVKIGTKAQDCGHRLQLLKRERKPEWDPSQGPASAHKGLYLSPVCFFLWLFLILLRWWLSLYSVTLAPQGSAYFRVGFQDNFAGLRPRSCLSGCVLFSIL